MAPQQILACGVAACTFVTVASLTAPGQEAVAGVHCLLTQESRLDELEQVGDRAVLAVRDLGPVQGPERRSRCAELPDVAVTYYVHGDPKRPARWRAEVDQRLEAHDPVTGEYEVTAGYPVRTGDGYVLPVTVAFAGHPRYRLSD